MQKAIILISLFIAQFAVAGDAELGKAKSVVCSSCHGADGNSANSLWPTLAGQHEEYTVRQLELFKSGERKDATMAGMASILSTADMQNIAAYYASQKANTGTADEKLVELGKAIYQGGKKKLNIPACMACHGIAGKGNPLSGYPVLAGQHATYTEKRLKAFKSGEIIIDKDDVNGKIMADVAKYLEDDEIKAVASYIQGLYSE